MNNLCGIGQGTGKLNKDKVTREERVSKAIKKYEDRGVDYIRPGLHAENEGKHQCEVDPSCPHTLRAFDDRFCLTYTLSGCEDYVLQVNNDIVWRTGGPPCYPTSRRLRGMVAIGDEDTIYENVSHSAPFCIVPRHANVL